MYHIFLFLTSFITAFFCVITFLLCTIFFSLQNLTLFSHCLLLLKFLFTIGFKLLVMLCFSVVSFMFLLFILFTNIKNLAIIFQTFFFFLNFLCHFSPLGIPTRYIINHFIFFLQFTNSLFLVFCF